MDIFDLVLKYNFQYYVFGIDVDISHYLGEHAAKGGEMVSLDGDVSFFDGETVAPGREFISLDGETISQG
jgi:hypothetical protein